MPYELSDVTFHCLASFTGRLSKWGSRTLQGRIDFDLLLPSQACDGDTRKMFCVRCTVYDPKDIPGALDYVEIKGRPLSKGSRVELMAFGKDLTILNRWISKKKATKCE